MGSPTPSTSLATNLISLTGNSVLIYFANNVIGYLQNFSGQDDYGMTPLAGIGDARPQEMVPGLYTGTLTADRAVIRKASIASLIGPDDTSSNDFINIQGALQGQIFDVAVIQKQPSSTTVSAGSNSGIVKWWKNCSIGAQSFQIQRNAIIYTNITIHALDTNGIGHGIPTTANQAVNDMDHPSGQ